MLTASSTLFLVSTFKRSNLHPIDRHVLRSVILQVESESTAELVDCNWASKMFQLPTRRMQMDVTRTYARRPFEAQPCFYTRRPRLHDGCSDRLGPLSIYITHARTFSGLRPLLAKDLRCQSFSTCSSCISTSYPSPGLVMFPA